MVSRRAINMRGGMQDFLKQSVSNLETRLVDQKTARAARQEEMKALQTQLDDLLHKARGASNEPAVAAAS